MNQASELPDLTRYSDAPYYNMQAVERATGLSPRTLRSWERRYGIPAPDRDRGGRRLYSERDMAVIRWLMERVESGMAIGRAVAMLSEEQPPRQPSRPRADPDRLQLRLLQVIDWMDDEEMSSVLSQALKVMPVERVVLELIQPVLYRVGDLWAAGRMSVASEHFGSEMLRSKLSELLLRSPQPWQPYHILVGSAPGELHDIGAMVVALFLRHAGFRVTYLGASLDGASLGADLRRISPHAVCLSATTQAGAEALADLFAAIRSEYGGVLVYGGRAFAGEPARHATVPGLYFGNDVQQAVALLGEELQGNPTAA